MKHIRSCAECLPSQTADRAQERRRDFTVDWVHLKLNDQAQRTVLCKDPFRSQDERVQRLIDGIAEGRSACTAASRQGADLWKLIWDRLDDIGLEDIELVKIASHQSRASVQDGSAGCTMADWLGNGAADKAACWALERPEDRRLCPWLETTSLDIF